MVERQNLAIAPVNGLRRRQWKQVNTFIIKMCGHGGERMVKVWVLNDKDEEEPAYFLVDGYEPQTNTVYQFHGCHLHGHTCLKNSTKRQRKRYKDTC